MPYSAPRLQGCGCVTSMGQRCAHQRARKAEADLRRPSARERGYTSKWETESKAFLAMPENQRCACGCGRKADMVDHIVPHRGDRKLFWSRSNWQPMASSPCHNRRKQSIEARGGVENFALRAGNRLGRVAQDRAEISFPAQVTK